MKIAIHQPCYLPYYGFFQKAFEADIFVLLDDTQYSNNNYQNYNSIKTPQGTFTLKIPIQKKFGQNIKDVKVNDSLQWREKHLKTIAMNYSRAKSFESVYSMLEAGIKQESEFLADINQNIIIEICNRTGFETEIIRASDLGLSSKKTDKIIDICQNLGADEYISGHGAKAYQDEKVFTRNGIKLTYIDLKPPKYKQLWSDNISNISFIDYLMNEGFEVPGEWITR